MSSKPTVQAIKPITPDEAEATAVCLIPDEVIAVFNSLITQNYRDGRAVVKQDEASTLISQRMGVPRQELFDKHWLDIETIFEEAGWDVVYDKPAYNEDYPATFTFSRFSRRKPGHGS